MTASSLAPVVEVSVPAVPALAPVGSVEAATRARLEAIGKLADPLGVAAVKLAERLDSSSGDTGASMAAVARQLQAILDGLAESVPAKGDVVDELARKRAARIAAGG